MSKRTVLIVDDSPISRKILRSCLPREAELELFEAGDGEAGLAAHRQHHPDVTFLDLTMVGMQGLECLEQIIAATPDALVVVVTADIQRHSVGRALELGALEVIPKPPSRDTVAAALARVEVRLAGAPRGP